MAINALQRFLSLGLLDIGEEDERFAKLRAASVEMGASIKDAPRLALYHTLVVLGQNTLSDDPCFSEVGSVLEKHWPTYKNRFKDVPRQIFRAIALDALDGAASENREVATAISYTTRTVKLPNPGTREDAVLREFVDAVQNSAEQAALENWSVDTNAAAKTDKAVTLPKLDRKKLLSGVANACGPQDAQGQATSGNPHWPNAGQPWATEFTARLAEVLASTVEAFVGTALPVPINSAREVAQEIARRSSALERRSRLLWWRHTLYSPLIRTGYRQLVPTMVVPLASLDLHVEVPAMAPISVEYLLRETICDAVSPAVKAMSPGDVSSQPGMEPLLKLLREHVPVPIRRCGQRTLFERVLDVASGSNLPNSEQADLTTQFAPHELGVRLFQEMQALRLTSGSRGTHG